jgi:arylsulfatase A-like enzyme
MRARAASWRSSDELHIAGNAKVGAGAVEKAAGIADNLPQRTGKGSLYQGGTRVPQLVRWSGKVLAAGTLRQRTVHVELFSTLLEISGAPATRQILDGESLAPLLVGKTSRAKRDAIFQHFPGYIGYGKGLWSTTPVSVIHSGDWKLME